MSEGDTPLTRALAQWQHILGAENVSQATSEYRHSTTGTERQIMAVLHPGASSEVQAIMRIASAHQIPIHPLSTGHNWGYGSANPVHDDCVIVDLGRMDRIRDFDPGLGTVTVEPGVTQEQLRAFLDEQDTPYLVPVTGAGPTCSILANALERGYGITPFTDHFSAVTSIEAVLPDGLLYTSPLREIGGHEVDQGFKWGIGPYLDGLFAQGGFGIVTHATVALAPQPHSVTAFFFGVSDERALARIIPTVRQVLREFTGQVPAINLLNRQRMLSMLVPFPENEASDGVLPPQVVAQLARENQIQAWNGVGAIYASPSVVAAIRRRLRRLLRPDTRRLVFVTDKRLNTAERVIRFLPRGAAQRVRTLVDTLRTTLRIMHGRPSEMALPLAYWRSGERPPAGEAMNPARDGCGLMWYAPLVPLKAEAVQRYLAMVENICPRYGLNPLVTLTTLNDRCFDSTVPLLFDRTDPAAVRRTKACYEALLAAGAEQGFLPYRLNNDAMEFLAENAPAYNRTAGRLKSALDPSHLVAPGRYTAGKQKQVTEHISFR